MELPASINPLGCVTIAVGQTLKFFKHPSTYEWDSMDNVYTNSVTSDFLVTLKKALNIGDNGTGHLSDAVGVLNNYGYNCSYNTHNAALTQGSLRKNKPVIQRGQESGKTVGHAWVCDGFSFSKEYAEYHLVGLGYSDYLRRYTYVEYKSNNNKVEWHDYGTTYYHMNWGWGGISDGWYLETLVDAPNKYSEGRMDLIISSLK